MHSGGNGSARLLCCSCILQQRCRVPCPKAWTLNNALHQLVGDPPRLRHGNGDLLGLRPLWHRGHDLLAL